MYGVNQNHRSLRTARRRGAVGGAPDLELEEWRGFYARPSAVSHAIMQTARLACHATGAHSPPAEPPDLIAEHVPTNQ